MGRFTVPVCWADLFVAIRADHDIAAGSGHHSRGGIMSRSTRLSATRASLRRLVPAFALGVGLASTPTAHASFAPGASARLAAGLSRIETVTDLSVAAAGPRATAAREVTFTGFGKHFQLDLVHNVELFPAGNTVTWIGSGGVKREEATPAVFYRGQVRGEPDSWARVTISGEEIDGIVFSGGETYGVTPLRALLGASAGSGTAIYRESDNNNGKDMLCGVHGNGAVSAQSARAPASDAAGLVARDSGGILRNTELTVVSDYEWFQNHGAFSALDMQTIINEADPIFRHDVGVRLTVLYTIVFDTIDDPFHGPDIMTVQDLVDALNDLGYYRRSLTGPEGRTDLLHLFSDRGVASGIAELCGVCDTGIDISLSVQSWYRLVAHELGHNFCAPHDGESGSQCSYEPKTYIMGSPGIAIDAFSPCTIAIMTPVAQSKSCLNDTTADCGNNVIDAGEDCDDGNVAEGDCCSGTCHFTPTAICRASTGLCDAAETCVPDAATCAPDTGISPDTDGDGVCDLQDPCAGGVSISAAKLTSQLGKSFKLKGQLTFVPPLALDPITNGLRLVLKDSEGGPGSDATVSGGAYNPTTKTGWTAKGNLTTWAFSSPSSINGLISKVKLTAKPTIPGLVKFSISAGSGAYGYADPTKLPTRATLMLEPPSGACGDTTFASCTFTKGKLACR